MMNMRYHFKGKKKKISEPPNLEEILKWLTKQGQPTSIILH